MRIVQLGDVVRINPRLPKKTASNKHTRVSFLPMAGVSEEGKITTSEERELGEVVKGYTYFEKGDVLLAKISPYFENGKSALVDDAIPHQIGFGSTEFHVLRASENIDLRYLFYMVWNPAFRFVGERNMTGTAGQKRVPVDFLRRYKIPLPPLAEQKRIAAILDKADAIRRKRQAAIKLADDFLRATFLDMFGDPVTNPKGWEVIPLGKLCRIRRGASPRPIARFLGGNVPWIKIGDGTKGGDIYIEDTKDKIIQEGVSKSVYLESGSLIFANCGVSLGFARIIKMDGCIHDGWLSFDQFDEHLNEIYLLKALNSVTNYFRQIAPDGTQPNLNTTIMKNFHFHLPPKKLQDRFSDIVMKFQKKNQNVKKSANNLSDLFNSLTQRTFRGEL